MKIFLFSKNCSINDFIISEMDHDRLRDARTSGLPTDYFLKLKKEDVLIYKEKSEKIISLQIVGKYFGLPKFSVLIRQSESGKRPS